MPIVVNPGFTDAPIITDVTQSEDDGAEVYANWTGIRYDIGDLVQANGYIGDSPDAGIASDQDTFRVEADATAHIKVHVDAHKLGSALNATIQIVNSAGAYVSTSSVLDDSGDPMVDFVVPATDTYDVIIAGSSLSNIGAYRVFISTEAPVQIYYADLATTLSIGGYKNTVIYGGVQLATAEVSNASTDLFIWHPGDALTLFEAGDGTDAFELDGNGTSETYSLADGTGAGRTDITSTAGTEHVDDVELFDFRGLGGSDKLTVARLTTLTGQIRFWGGDGKDMLNAPNAVNHFFASGGAGDDQLKGGTAGDVLAGDAGNDVLAGGRGQDRETGGAGRDVFTFASILDSRPGGMTRDTLTDFRHSQHDRIDLRAIDADQRAGHGGDQSFVFIGAQSFAAYHKAHPTVFGMVRFDAAHHLLQANVDGTFATDFELSLPGVSGLAKADLML